ncbi:MAG: flagellar basal body-associated FliL family protein [Sutterellaceae bacterium]|nr:flagellar basal body-associated FliL family protein [Burkholderiaceae bacterium]MCX7902075.1 flagellar basal body-associated FliL family protein [Burkholderiaceae bacterium]MDW8431011.1 flagellar basal body-associated FliL family protein [Sutterellaceae bacterium]
MAGSEAKTDAAAATSKRNKTKLLVIAAAALLLLLGGGAAAYFMLGKADKQVAASEEEDDAPAEKSTKAKKKKKKAGLPVFVELDMFTANLRDADGDRYIQVKLVAEVKDAATGEALKAMMPAVRNEVLLLLGSKEAKEVATREGKERLASEIVAAANKTLEGTPAAGGVEAVNFTHIIVQ